MRDTASFTAQITCAARSLLGVDPPFATGFLSWRGRALLRGWRLAERFGLGRLDLGMARGIVARHRFIDEALLWAVECGVQQIVLLGCGYDARPWRLATALEGCELFLVDHPLTAAHRTRVAQGLPPASGRRVDVDFSNDDFGERLIAAGFDPSRPSFFSWEGVSMYLEAAQVRATLERCRSLCAPGSSLAFDALAEGPGPNASMAVRRLWPLTVAALDLLGEPIGWRAEFDALDRFLNPLGFTVSHGNTTDILGRQGGLDGAFGGLSVVVCEPRTR